MPPIRTSSRAAKAKDIKVQPKVAEVKAKAAAKKAAKSPKETQPESVSQAKAKTKAASNPKNAKSSTKTTTAKDTSRKTVKRKNSGDAAPAKPSTTKKSTTTKAKTTAPATKKAPAKSKQNNTKAPAKNTTSKAVETEKAATSTMTQPAPKPVANMKRKRDSGVEETEKRVVKKPKIVLTHRPTQRLDVYVCGEGGNGELGLGNQKALNVSRPRLNRNLAADTVGVVAVAAGGMHSLALTHDNKIMSWGINDLGTLGRDTDDAEVLKDAKDGDAASDADSDDESDSGALNVKEATPTAIPSDAFPEGTVLTQVCCGDSSSWALTDDGQVYGWGHFRDANGSFGFTKTGKGDAENVTVKQKKPYLMPTLKGIIQLAAGADHALALDNKGSVFAWGCGDAGQLGRKFVDRRKFDSLLPARVALPKGKVASIGVGANHSFAILSDGSCYAWGLNNYGQCGFVSNAGADNATILKPVKINDLPPIKQVSGGNMNSVALTEDGKVLTFGRIDMAAGGFDLSTLAEDEMMRNGLGKPAILLTPHTVDAVPQPATFVNSGSEHVIAVGSDGRIYSWGFNACYQLGDGDTDDQAIAGVRNSKSVEGKKIVGAGAGGQFSLFWGEAGQ